MVSGVTDTQATVNLFFYKYVIRYRSPLPPCVFETCDKKHPPARKMGRAQRSMDNWKEYLNK